jgi:hypothetical protein
MESLSADELSALSKSYFRGVTPMCPRCGTALRVDESRASTPAAPAVAVGFRCPKCEVRGWDNGLERRQAARDLTGAEKVAIFDAYWREGRSRCPADGALVAVNVTKTNALSIFSARCKYCGTNFQDERSRL